MEKDILFQKLVYLGNIIGSRILSDYNKIAVVSLDNFQCNVFSASIESSYLATNIARFTHTSISESNVEKVVQKTVSFSPEAIILAFGGEEDKRTEELLTQLLSKLFAAECHADLFFDAVNLKKKVVENVISHESPLRFLEENNTYAITIDPEEGIVMLNEAIINKDRKIELYALSEYPISFDYARLLKIAY